MKKIIIFKKAVGNFIHFLSEKGGTHELV